MSQELNRSLALAKQHYEELVALVPMGALERREYGTDLKRQRVEELLKKLTGLITVIRQRLSEHLTQKEESPILELSPGHKTFYTTILDPHAEKLYDAYWDITGLSELNDLLKGLDTSRKGTPVANAISWGIERWEQMVDEDEKTEWFERGFDLETAFEFVSFPFFEPDDWLENFRLLRPVLVDRPARSIPQHVQYRLREIYRAFTFGLWMGAIGLSRSVTEYSIIDNASRLKIEVTRTNRRGNVETKSLEHLIDAVSAVRPTLRTPMETIRDAGNRILHPTKHDVIAFPKVMRQEALDCVTHAKAIVESLYAA